MSSYKILRLEKVYKFAIVYFFIGDWAEVYNDSCDEFFFFFFRLIIFKTVKNMQNSDF